MMQGLEYYSDEEIVRLYRTDLSVRRVAFEALYLRHEQPVFLFSLRFVGDRQEAEDITQEVFVTLISVLESEVDLRNIRPYLLGIARNSCINFLRKQRRHPKLPFDVVEESLSLPDTDSVEHRQLMELLSQAIQTLEVGMRDCFILRMYQGLSYEEIASLCGVSVNTARTRVWRAKECLQMVLAPIIRELEDL